jgi:hypothetical protein
MLALVASIVGAQPIAIGVPRIDAIEFYGLHRVSAQLAQQALGLKVGDPLPPSKGDAEERVLDIGRVLSARLESVCCDGGNILYVGVEERDQQRFAIRPAPGGAVVLPDEVLRVYATARNNTSAFPALATKHVESLREVSREAGDESQRAIAVLLLPFTNDKAAIVDDLHTAMTDNDALVRSAAIRGLASLALLEAQDPATRIRVSGAWLFDPLLSVAWTDRMEAVRGLEQLTRTRDAYLLSRVQDATLDALVEMARWRTEAHAYPAFQLLGRVVGLPELEIRDAWLRAGRETVIAQALKKGK